MSIRLPDKLLANIVRFLIREQNFTFRSRSELVRESLFAFEELLKTAYKDKYEEFKSTNEARAFLENISGARFTGNRNKCSFEEQVLFEETGMQRRFSAKGNSPIETSANNGAMKNAFKNESSDEALYNEIAKQAEGVERKRQVEEQTIEMVINGTIPMASEEDLKQFLLNHGLTEEEIQRRLKDANAC
jgi:Arc/MetJ-type ribon-helix-helix transcriptional regulator